MLKIIEIDNRAGFCGVPSYIPTRFIRFDSIRSAALSEKCLFLFHKPLFYTEAGGAAKPTPPPAFNKKRKLLVGYPQDSKSQAAKCSLAFIVICTASQHDMSRGTPLRLLDSSKFVYLSINLTAVPYTITSAAPCITADDA